MDQLGHAEGSGVQLKISELGDQLADRLPTKMHAEHAAGCRVRPASA